MSDNIKRAYKALLDKYGIDVSTTSGGLYANDILYFGEKKFGKAPQKDPYEKIDYYLNKFGEDLDNRLNNGRFKDLSGVKELQLYFGDAGDGGEFDPKYPKAIKANLNEDTFNLIGTISHENQHLKDNILGVPNLFSKSFTKGEGLKRSISLDKIYEKYKDRYSLPDDFTKYPWVHLSAIQAQLPVGKNIFDTDLGKEIASQWSKDSGFSEQAVKNELYYAMRPLNNTYITTQAEEDNKGLLQSFKEWIIEKSRF